MAGEKILVVDDEQSMTQFLGIMVDPFTDGDVDGAHVGIDGVKRPALVAKVVTDGDCHSIRVINIPRRAAESCERRLR